MIRRLLLVAVAAAALAVLRATPASAHDELERSAPSDGFTVTTLPAVVRLTFAEETDPRDVTVTVAGKDLPVTALAGDLHTVIADLAGVPATQTVALDWRTIDEHDGHAATGTIRFHVIDHLDATPSPTSPAPVQVGGVVASVPAGGYSVTTLPLTATMTFAERTRPGDLVVRSGNRQLPTSAVPGVPTTVSVDLRGVRATRTVALTWSVRRPGARHAVAGVISFHVLEHVADAGAAGHRSSAGALHVLTVITRAVGYLAMAVLLGGLFFVSTLWPDGARERRTRVLLGGATVAGIASAVAGVALTLDQVSPLTFREGVAQHFGRVSVAVALMWLLASVVVTAVLQRPSAVRSTPWRVGAIVVTIGLIRSVGMSAHDTQGSHARTGVLVDFLHLVGVSAWVGGLAVMAVGLLPRRRLEEIEAVVPRFSRVAATSVTLVVASGAVLAFQLIGSVGAVFSTHYGQILLVKLLFVGLVLLAAMASKRWVSHRLARGDGTTSLHSFMVSVSTETVFVIAVLGAASVLVTSSPGL